MCQDDRSQVCEGDGCAKIITRRCAHGWSMLFAVGELVGVLQFTDGEAYEVHMLLFVDEEA